MIEVMIGFIIAVMIYAVMVSLMIGFMMNDMGYLDNDMLYTVKTVDCK